jgi:hypothetical protein
MSTAASLHILANICEYKFGFHLQLPVTQSLLTVLNEHQSLPSNDHMWYCHLLRETVVTTRKSTRIFKDFNNAVIIPTKKKLWGCPSYLYNMDKIQQVLIF